MVLPRDQLSITLSVPEKILEGLRSGDYERVGGVVRHAAESGKPHAGQVVAWLRESPQLARLTQNAADASKMLPAAVSQQLEAIGAGISAVIGLQILTLGVTVAGFQMVSARLRALDRKLDHVLDELRDIRSEVGWLIKRADVETLALVVSAVESARIAETALPPGDAANEFRFARRELTKARSQLAALADLLIREDQIWERPQVLPIYAQLFLSTVTAEVRTSLLLGHNDAAIEVTRAGRSTAEEILSAYRTRLGSPLTAIHEGRAADIDSSSFLGEGKALFEDTILRLEGHESEISFLRSSGIAIREWEALSDGAEEPTIICIEPASRELVA